MSKQSSSRRPGPIDRLAGGLIVSCQARPGSPLRRPEIMAAMAVAAQLAGAVGIRAAGHDDIMAIRDVVDLPIVGLTKRTFPDSDVVITATPAEAVEVAEAGADIVAIDATGRRRPDDGTIQALIDFIHRTLDLPVLADIDTLHAGAAAVEAGADLLATTLSGYTGGHVPQAPDLELVAGLTSRFAIPVIAEGRYANPDDVQAALRSGAHAVVVGAAITDTIAITERFVRGTMLVRGSEL